MNSFWEKVFGLMAGAMTKQDLREAGASEGSKIGTFSMPIEATGYSVDAEEIETRRKIVEFMRSQLGLPYRLGAEIQPGHETEATESDCSESVEAAYRVCGKFIPDGAQQQYDFCQTIKNPLPGDLGFLWSDKRGKIGHVMMYTEMYTFIHAVGGRGVVEDPISMWDTNPRFRGARRHPDFSRPLTERG